MHAATVKPVLAAMTPNERLLLSMRARQLQGARAGPPPPARRARHTTASTTPPRARPWVLDAPKEKPALSVSKG